MVVLYVLPILAWLAVVGFMAPAVWSIYVQQTRRGDQARLVCFLFALLMLGFLTRRVVTGERIDQSLGTLLLASTCVAVFTLFAAVNYGRGDRV